MAHSARAIYLDYYEQIKSKLASYPETFQSLLGIIMDRIEDLQFQPHENWEENCGSSIEDSVGVILRHIEEDVKGWEALPQQKTSLSLKGNIANPANVKAKSVKSITNMVADWQRDSKGVEPVPTENLHALLCHEISVAPHWNKYMKFPANMKQMYPKWDTKLEEDSHRFCVTATPTGNVTRVHHDDVCLDSRIMHVAGRKLWVMWENSEENTAAVRTRTIPYGEIDLQWLLNHLTPPKLYFTADLGPNYFHYIFLPHHAWHMVFCFSTSFAISGSFHSIPSLEPALLEIEEEISHLMDDTIPMEKNEKLYWTSLLTRNILHWENYVGEMSEHIAEEQVEKFWELRDLFDQKLSSTV